MGLQSLELELDWPMVVMVADNGIGKSSVLKGLRVAIGSYLRSVDDPDVRAPGIKRYMLRREFHHEGFDLVLRYTGPATIRASGCIGGQNVTWSRSLNLTRDARTTWRDTRGLRDAIDASADPYPLLAYYGARSRFPNGPTIPGQAPPVTRQNAYADALEGPIDFQERFGRWRRLVVQAAQRPEAMEVLKELERRLSDLLPGVESVSFNAEHDGPVVEFSEDVSGGGVRAFDDLSDGFQNVLAIGLDLSLRALQLNPDLGTRAFDEVTGVVLIDEVAQNLHPAWQLEVTGGFRRLFPRVQFILSTHSPLVALGAPDDALILRLEARDGDIIAEQYTPSDLGPTVETALRGPAFDLSTTWAPAVEELLEARANLAEDTMGNAVELKANAESLEKWLSTLPAPPSVPDGAALTAEERSELRLRMASRLSVEEP